METININEELIETDIEINEADFEDDGEFRILKPSPIGVYVKRDSNGKIVNINSEIFIDDLTGWEKIDEGYGDEFAHAQTQYKAKTDGE